MSIDGYGCSVHKGWNCIDTASNYRDGRGETATGYALRSLRTANVGITRDMLFIRCARPAPSSEPSIRTCHSQPISRVIVHMAQSLASGLRVPGMHPDCLIL